MTINFRLMEDLDRRFVIDAWCKSFQFSNCAGMIAVDRWFSVMIPEVERILDREGTRTVVAYEDTDESRVADLYGFLCHDPSETPPVVFYAYVKEAYRRCGVARSLFRAATLDPMRPFIYTCTTAVLSKIRADRKIPIARWAPLIARFPKDNHRKKTT